MEENVQLQEGEIVGIRFSLATHKEVCIASINNCSICHSTRLTNPFLGLPLEFGKCESCGTSEPGQCEGHFGYIELPVPIYHRSHVSELKQLLSLLCLKCLKLKNSKLQMKNFGMAKWIFACCEESSQVSIKEVSKHSSFQDSRCFYLVSTDGQRQDFSYRKCLESFIKGKYPDLSEEFVGKYFARTRGNRQRNPVPEYTRDGNLQPTLVQESAGDGNGSGDGILPTPLSTATQ